jgi:polyhydroxyalkanoate synthesis repressor PhaR
LERAIAQAPREFHAGATLAAGENAASSCIAAKEAGFSSRRARSRAQDDRSEGDVADSNGNQATGEGASETPQVAPVVIKKYANRRLYNTSTSSYVTLDSLSEMVREGTDFIVQDAKTGDDITRSVLTQIIFEQESRGQNLLPVQFLRRLIRVYGDSMQGYLPPYLEMSMESFSKGQEQMREHMSRSFGGKTPVAAFEDQAKRNMALFQQALSLWSPFGAGASMQGFPTRPPASAEDADDAVKDRQLNELRRQMEAMQKQLDDMTKR